MATRAALVTKRRPLICATSKKVKPLEAAEAVLQLDRRVDEVDGAAPPEARVLFLNACSVLRLNLLLRHLIMSCGGHDR